MVGFWQIVTFFALLVTGYIYVWRKGAFDWSGGSERAVERRQAADASHG